MESDAVHAIDSCLDSAFVPGPWMAGGHLKEQLSSWRVLVECLE